MIEAGETDLTGRVWPVHLKPQEDELLSSWLARLALAHGQTASSFFTRAWPGRYLLARDLDLWNDQTALKLLARKTNTPLARVFATTLASYEGWLFVDRPRQSHAPWMLARHLNVRPQKHFGLQFCPWCLASDEEPYFRRYWRLALMVLCPIHRVLLLDRCQSCGAAVCYERQTAKKLGNAERWMLTQCNKCNADLRDSATDRYCIKVDLAEFEFHVFLATALRHGWVEMPQNGMIYSHLFFSGLYQMMGRLIYGRMAGPLKAALWQSYAIDLPLDFLLGKKFFLERLNVAQRRGLLQAVNRLLEEWPDRFIEFCQANKLNSYFLIGDKKVLPFWYLRVVREHLTKGARKVSNEEVISTVSYVRNEGGQPSAPELNRFLSDHIIKRARRAGLIVAKEKQHPGLCRHCQATQRQFKSGFSRHGTQQFRCGECGRIYQQHYETGRKRPSTIQLSSENSKTRATRVVSGGSLA
ncbi:MAG TPA: TniQ family protein [Pyrinomonadaceae bacterium]|nr:TniQ family protein [Pyrinomonadaceae bacterium]